MAQVNPHGDHHHDQGVTCPFLEGEQADPLFGNVDYALDIPGSQFRKAEEVNPSSQQQASQNQEEDRP